MKRFLCVLLTALVILSLAAVPAGAADLVPIGSTFDSGSAYYSDISDIGNLNPTYAPIGQSHQVPGSSSYHLGFSPSMFETPSISLVQFGTSGNYLFGVPGSGQWRIGSAYTAIAAWTMPLTNYNLYSGRMYRFSIENFVSSWDFSMVSSSYTGTFQFEVRVDIVNEHGVSLEGGVLYDTTSPLPGSSAVLNTYGPEDMAFEFEMPEVDDCALRLSVSYYVHDLSSPFVTIGNISASPYWVCFEGAGLYGVPGEDEIWQDEQRGFWANVLAWFQRLWDGITAIPERIGEFFQNLIDTITGFFRQIWDAIEMIGAWLMAILNLLIKAATFFGTALGFLPWWLYTAAIVLVAICVIYKILGRESTG